MVLTSAAADLEAGVHLIHSKPLQVLHHLHSLGGSQRRRNELWRAYSGSSGSGSISRSELQLAAPHSASPNQQPGPPQSRCSVCPCQPSPERSPTTTCAPLR
jgi:hypothetical protein